MGTIERPPRRSLRGMLGGHGAVHEESAAYYFRYAEAEIGEPLTEALRGYELAMIELVPPENAPQHVQNFRLLQSVVASLEGVAEVRSADPSTF